MFFFPGIPLNMTFFHVEVNYCHLWHTATQVTSSYTVRIRLFEGFPRLVDFLHWDYLTQIQDVSMRRSAAGIEQLQSVSIIMQLTATTHLKNFSKGMAMITQVVRFYYRFQKPSMIGLPWWQIALTRIFGAKYINAFPPARGAGGHVWMFWKKHQELVANSPRWAKARELHRDWADLGLPENTQKINVKWCQSKQLSGKWLVLVGSSLKETDMVWAPREYSRNSCFRLQGFLDEAGTQWCLRKMWLFPWYYVLFCIDLCYFMFPSLLEAG